MRFCGFQPPSQWCFVTGNKTGAPPSTTSPGPKRKPPRVTKRYSRSGGKRPVTSRGRGPAHTDPSPWPGWKQVSGVPEAQPGLGVGPFPSCLLPEQTGSGGEVLGAQPLGGSIGRKRKMSVCPLVTVSVTSTRPEGHRPAQCPPAVMGTPSLPPQARSRGCPKPQASPAGPWPKPTEPRESCVAVACVGAAEGSPFFPNLFLAAGDSLQC